MDLDLKCPELLSSVTHTLTPQPTSIYLHAHDVPLLLGALTRNSVLTISLDMLCFITVWLCMTSDAILHDEHNLATQSKYWKQSVFKYETHSTKQMHM